MYIYIHVCVERDTQETNWHGYLPDSLTKLTLVGKQIVLQDTRTLSLIAKYLTTVFGSWNYCKYSTCTYMYTLFR